jgi:hypothetical protein
MANLPPLPAGFTLDSTGGPPSTGLPPLPPGFTLDGAKPAQSGLARAEDTSLEGGLRETAANLATGAIATPLAGIAGLGAATLKGMGVTSTDPADVVRNVQSALTYEPRTTAGKVGVQIATYPLRKLAQGADYVGGKVADVTGSPAAGAAVNTVLQAAPMVLLKGRGRSAEVAGDAVPPAVDRPVAAGEAVQAPPVAPERPPGLASVSEAAPTKEALKSASQAAYAKAEQAGAVVTAESFEKAKGTIQSMLDKQGLDPTLHPDTTAALKRITDTEGPVTLEKLETLRRIAKDAEGSAKPADRRLAAKTVDTLDNYTSTLSQKDLSAGTPDAVGALNEARNLWSRQAKADTLDELMSRAELSAPNFSGSGMENAVRTEFRGLAKNPRRMRLFTPEEQAAIRRVAQGGAVENTLRMLGKLAPTGSLSTAISAGAGFVAGGPGGAVALPVAGAAARLAATRMTLRNAARANELVRRGPANALAPVKRNALAESP